MPDQELKAIDQKLTAILALAASSLATDDAAERRIMEMLLRVGLSNSDIGLVLGKTANAIAIAKTRMGKGAR